MAPEGLDGSNKKLHPFFVPGKTTETPAAQSSTTEQAATLNEKTQNKRPGRPRKQTRTPQTASSDIELRSSDVEDDGRDRKRQKTDGSTPSSGKKRGRPRKKPIGTTTDIANHFSQKDGSSSTKLANEVPRTPPPEPGPTAEQHSSCAPPPTSASKSEAASEPNPPSAPSAATEQQPKPTKVLKFNPKTGTIGSPPKPKPVVAEASKGTKSSKPPAKLSRVVTIKYGHDTDSRARIGPKIQQILASPSAKKSSPKSKTTPKKSRPTAPKPEEKSKPKGTHPLFLGKSKTAAKPDASVAPAPKPPRQTVFSSTPCSPKKQRSVPMSGKVPQFGIRSMGLKVPGSCHPAWPAQGMAHVRGLTTEEDGLSDAVRRLEVSSRKSKGQTTNIMPSESIINQLALSLDTVSLSKSILEATDDDYQPPPPELRLPGKHFESGRKLRSRIKSELRTCLPLGKNSEDSDDEVLTTTRRKPHPAIARLYNSLETNLSAYDKSQCEELTWAQKYAPVLAEEILQSGKEGILLKEWLQTLTIHSVHTGVANTDQKSSGPKSGLVPKKKRKRNKVDDFIVSDGDETEFLPSVSDEDEDDWFPMTSHGAPKKTVVRKDLGKDMSRLTNAVVLSGPHGSGKTAAVYAVAKELGFEIFEINASSRRTGKDVMEKVGDMTQNHLVQRNRQGKDDDPKEDDETTKDIKSGKQGTMMSFFKPKTASKPATEPEQKSKPKAEEPTEAPKPAKATGQSQKQSLILLEEVDVLYEEDKQFWATIISLIAQSKRPFVMTCNDETLVPFHNFILYGIFRFTPPPKDLAVDTLLLIAANEGHALQRAAVSALYESKGHDLRASLMDLNYWCQLGVGDRRGGFDWFYPRWPKGCDKDENGDVVRVVSEGTYLEGMGWVSRDPAVTSSPRAAEEEFMTQCWRGLGLDLGNWHDSLDLVSWANSLQTSAAADRVAALDVFSEFSEAMSTADLCSSGDYGLRFQEPLDPTQPDITNKMRDDFVIGRRLLEAPPLTTFVCTATAIATSLKSAARQILQSAPKRTQPTVSMDCIQERKAIQQMRRSFAEPIEDTAISRYDMSLAFDPIAISEKAAASISTSLEPSVFDRTMRMITLEVAPYVRSIVDYDHRLMQERQQRSSLLSEGGRPGKRMRSTRSALSAQEGVTRASARRESYFSAELNTPLVMRTGGEDWQAAVDAEMRLMPQAASVASSDHGGEVAAPSSSSEVPVQCGEVPIECPIDDGMIMNRMH